MSRKLICLIIFVLAPAVSAQTVIEFFSDDFETPHDYIANGADGTGWDDYFGRLTGESIDALNANMDRAGQLYIQSSDGTWDSPWNPLAPFIYKYVEGDFIATVQITDYAGTAEESVFHNDGGLMARASKADPYDEAGTGEDWISIDYFPIWACGNFHWSADNDVRTEHGHNGKAFDLDPWLQLERRGNTFHLRTSTDGVNWTEMATSPQTRDDFDGLPLQVGLRQAIYNSGETGYVAFDDFSIVLLRRFKAYAPIPADGALPEDTWVNLTWSPGSSAVSHDVYFGENLDDVKDGSDDTFLGNQAETFFIVGISGFPYPDGLIPGTTYYWRIDEVNDLNPNSPWQGDVWSFSIPPKTAYNPDPPDGAECVPLDTVLSWTAGAQATTHWVYFGTTDLPPFKGLKTPASYEPPELLPDTQYYWRIDEKKGTQSWPGELWTFRTVPYMPVTDPNLVGWWKLDEVCGDSTTVLDSSGNDHHGTFVGDVQYVDGSDGDALEFDGRNDYVELPIGSAIGSLTNSTFAIWLDSQPGGSWARAFDFGTDNPNVYMCLGPRWWFMDDMYFAITTEGADNQSLVQPTGFDIETGWHHVAVTIDAEKATIILYYDGEELARNDSALLSPSDLGETTNNWLGRSHDEDDSYYLGSMDDFRIYNYALTQAEIEKVMMGDPLLAWNPKPTDGSTLDVEHISLLSWSPGDNAAQHDIYFGTDENAVENADTSDTTNIYRGRQDPNTYTLTETLEWERTYYWRIDEINNDQTISKGRIWSFTVADFILVDDFESYDAGDNQVWYSWHDGLGYGTPGTADYFAGNGTGAAVGDETSVSYMEETIVHSGGRSLPFYYDNNKQGYTKYSEIELTLMSPRDWTIEDVAELSLWFRGYPAYVGSFVEGPAGTFTITGSGADIWGQSDQFHYAFKELTGIGSVVARVESLTNTNPSAKAAVMIRETLDPDSKYSLVALTPDNGVIAELRAETGGNSEQTASLTSIVSPYWVKIERDLGGNLTAYSSANGSTWEVLGQSIPFQMASNAYVGLAVTAHDATATCQAKFSNVTITGNAGSLWSNQDIGIQSNEAEPLYVAIANSTGNPAVVVHDNPDAALIDTWTEWVIPLQTFADQGINLSDIDRIAIGVGTKGNTTTPGSAGKMFIDDIRLYRSRVTAE
ncbi:LamG-like jellyroll fold domain-containing protein [Planctomycetota bacterium]